MYRIASNREGGQQRPAQLLEIVFPEEGAERGVQPDNPVIYDPVSGPAALSILILSTVVLLGVGMWLFRRTEYVSGE